MQQKPKTKEKRLKGLNAQETQKNVTLHSCYVCLLFVLWDCNYCNGIIDELLAEQISQLCIINTIQ